MSDLEKLLNNISDLLLETEKIYINLSLKYGIFNEVN